MTGPLQKATGIEVKQVITDSDLTTTSTKKLQPKQNTNPFIQKLAEFTENKSKTSFENLITEINNAYEELVARGLNKGLDKNEQVSLNDLIDHKNEQAKQKFLNAVKKNLAGDSEAIQQQFLAGEAVLAFLNKCSVVDEQASQDGKITSVNVYQGKLRSDYGDEINYRYQQDHFLSLSVGQQKIILKPDGILKLACRNIPGYPALQTQLDDAHGLSPEFNLIN